MRERDKKISTTEAALSLSLGDESNRILRWNWRFKRYEKLYVVRFNAM